MGEVDQEKYLSADWPSRLKKKRHLNWSETARTNRAYMYIDSRQFYPLSQQVMNECFKVYIICEQRLKLNVSVAFCFKWPKKHYMLLLLKSFSTAQVLARPRHNEPLLTAGQILLESNLQPKTSRPTQTLGKYWLLHNPKCTPNYLPDQC